VSVVNDICSGGSRHCG